MRAQSHQLPFRSELSSELTVELKHSSNPINQHSSPLPVPKLPSNHCAFNTNSAAAAFSWKSQGSRRRMVRFLFPRRGNEALSQDCGQKQPGRTRWDLSGSVKLSRTERFPQGAESSVFISTNYRLITPVEWLLWPIQDASLSYISISLIP